MAGQHMFVSLKTFSTKLSKSQQRHTINTLRHDDDIDKTHKDAAKGGLCISISLIWLKERLRHHFSRTDFPRLAHKNVVNSKRAYNVTKKAAEMEASLDHENQVTGNCRILGLTQNEILTNVGYEVKGFTSISGTLATKLTNGSITGKGFLLSFTVGDSAHSVAFFIKNNRTVEFYDSNAGSYRINGSLGSTQMRNFLNDYFTVCLPLKWPNTHVTDELKVWAIS